MFSLIVMRMSGAIGLSPVFGSSSIPKTVRGALILVLSLVLYTGFDGTLQQEPTTMVEYCVMLMGELLFGVVLSFAMELSFMAVRFASSLMDYLMGLSMAQVYDPQYHTQMTISSGIYYAFLILLFFSTDGHLRLISIFYDSAYLIPFGTISLRPELSEAILTTFREGMVLGIQLTLPMIAMELVAEAAIGILMRMIPQINVFVVNFQIKIIVGLSMMVFLFEPLSNKLQMILESMNESFQYFITLMG